MTHTRTSFSWLALFAGSMTILVLGLLAQLLFVALAVGQLMFIKQFPQWQQLAEWMLYGCGLALLFVAMAGGGYVTAYLARGRLLLHGSAAALVAGGISFAQSLNVGGLTLVGVALFLLAIPFTLAGCWLRMRHTQLTW